MARTPRFTDDMRERITRINTDEMQAIKRLPTLETDDEDFGQIFMKNPGLALAAKGIEVTPTELQDIRKQLDGIKGQGDGTQKTEISVKVGIKF